MRRIPAGWILSLRQPMQLYTPFSSKKCAASKKLWLLFYWAEGPSIKGITIDEVARLLKTLMIFYWYLLSIKLTIHLNPNKGFIPIANHNLRFLNNKWMEDQSKTRKDRFWWDMFYSVENALWISLFGGWRYRIK